MANVHVGRTTGGPTTGGSTAIGLLGLVSIIWGAAFPLTNIAVHSGMSSITVATVRILLAAIVLFGLAVVARSNLSHLTIANLRRLAPVALLSLVVPHTLMTWSQHYISSSHAVIIMATVPLTTALFVSLPSHSDNKTKISRSPTLLNNVIKLLPGFLGVAILVGSAALHGDKGVLIGSAAAMIASVSCAKAIIIMSKLPSIPPIAVGSSISIVAFMIMMPLFFTTDHDWDAIPSAKVIISILFLGVICTGLSSVLYFNLASNFGAIFASLSFYICPIVGILLSAIIIGDRISVWYFVSVTLVLSSVYFISPPAGFNTLHWLLSMWRGWVRE